jgi:hypothetical protein
MQGAIGTQRRLVAILSLVTALAIVPSVTGATPPRGGSGGQAFDLDCGADSVLAGVVARTGSLVDAVEALCVKVKADGSWSGGPSSKGRAGGSGGGPASLSCDAGWAVIGIHGRSGALVDRLGVRCGKLGVQGGTVKIVEGNIRRGPSGGSGGAPFDDSCPGGQVGRGLKGRAGKLVDQIELVCHTPAVPSSAPPQVMRKERPRLEGREFQQQVPSGQPAQPTGPRYDLELVSAGAAMRETSLGGERYGLWDVTVRNLGDAEVVQATLECQAGGLRFGQFTGGPVIAPGQSATLQASYRLPALWDIATAGNHAGTCTVGIIQPSGVTDANPANNTRNVTFTVPPRVVTAPDLYVTSLVLRDCATRGVATATAPVCAEIVGGNSPSAPVESAWQAQCSLGTRTATAPGTSPLPNNRTLLLFVRFENIPAGDYPLSCTLDSANQLADPNRTNNSRTATVTVRP